MCLCIYRPPRRKSVSDRNLNMLPVLFMCIVRVAYSSNPAPGSRSILSPRMQYDEWTPLGRGDPLKNDPTFDYVPPVLEKVHYWVPPAARTPDPPRSSTSSTTAVSTPPVPVIQDRFQDLGVTKIRQPYVPVYYQYRPSEYQRTPYTILVPPPPDKPHSYSPQSPISITQTVSTVTANDFWETQLATVAQSTQSQYEEQQFQDVTPAPSVLHVLLNSELASTVPPPTPKPATNTQPTKTTIANPSLTTDPLFSHYKQPVEPLRGPMYLIIQGHSKVKTYGPAKIDKISGIPVQETNEVSDDDFQIHKHSR